MMLLLSCPLGLREPAWPFRVTVACTGMAGWANGSGRGFMRSGFSCSGYLQARACQAGKPTQDKRACLEMGEAEPSDVFGGF